MDELQQLIRLRSKLEGYAGRLRGEAHDMLCFEIGEIDLRLRELWSGEDSGLKQVTLVSPPTTDDRTRAA